MRREATSPLLSLTRRSSSVAIWAASVDATGRGVPLASVADAGYAAGLDERRLGVVVAVYRQRVWDLGRWEVGDGR